MSALERFDDALYRAEKAVVAGALALMGVVVFLDVVHRVSTREGSLLASPVVMGVAACLLASAAFHTRGASQAVPKGIGTGVVLVALQHAFVWAMPNGIVWSQHQGGLVVSENYFEDNCGSSTIDVANDTLSLSDDVTEYNAVVCQTLPTTSRQMTKPVFRVSPKAWLYQGIVHFCNSIWDAAATVAPQS